MQTYERLDVLQDNFMTNILIKLRYQLGISFAFLAQQVELLLLVAKRTHKYTIQMHQYSAVKHIRHDTFKLKD